MTVNVAAPNRALNGRNNVVVDHKRSAAGPKKNIISRLWNGILERSKAGGLYSPQNRQIASALAKSL